MYTGVSITSAKEEIDYAIAGMVGKKVIVFCHSGSTYIKGILKAYDGIRALIEDKHSCPVVCFLGPRMYIEVQPKPKEK